MNQSHYLACVLSNQFPGEDKIRRDIAETLAGMQTIATGFSFPPLTEGYLWKLQQLAIEDADLCVFIVGSNYGSISPTGVGFLHRAYAHAQAVRKPCLVLVAAEADPQADAMEKRRREGLLHEMGISALVRAVGPGDAVRSAVETFVDDLLTQDVLTGLYRSEDLPGDDSQRVQELTAQVEKMRLLLGEQRRAEASTHKPMPVQALNYRVKVFRDGNVAQINRTLRSSWNDIFAVCAPLLTSPQREADWKSQLEERLLVREAPLLKVEHPKAHSFVDFRLDGVAFDQIKRHFRALDWIQQHQGVWSLSPLGEHHWLALKPSP
ncbi:DUF4062 domain-containing protein [Salinispirillum sp. LH 10-3-1]|uniref:DUF4062 domain-containing protein n=1 Tax=Salinispirillum sp. LH 10-3-1 TaxID=2952525 RepID=A0AB38YCM5_9GAMM